MNQKKERKTKIIIAVVALVVLFVWVFNATQPPKSSGQEAKSATPTQTEQSSSPQQAQTQLVPPYKKIQDNVSGISNRLSPQLFKADALADENTTPPYEVVINSKSLSEADALSCDNAKNVAYELMKKLYTDSDTKDKITRVLINIPFNFRISLGSVDGLGLTSADNWSGKTNFFSVYDSYQGENEGGAVQDRTWIAYTGDCY